jgi:hypothetical protein
MFGGIFGTLGRKVDTRSHNELILSKLDSIASSCKFISLVFQFVVGYMVIHWLGII